MPEYACVFLNKQDSEYAYGTKYATILNSVKFWIWQGSQYASVSQGFEYATIFLGWQSSECISDFKYASIQNIKQLQRVL